MFLSAHVAEAAPHHLELIDQFLVQGTHFWVHQLLVHSQADSEHVNLQENTKTSSDCYWTFLFLIINLL